MSLSIKHKLLLTILAAISLVVISIYLVGHWNFQRGFIRFVNTTELARLEQLASDLQGLYADEGNWSDLRDRPGRWMRLLREADNERPLPPRAGNFLEKQFRDQRRPMPRDLPPDQLRHYEARVVLLDVNQDVLFGFPHLFEEIKYKPLKHNGAMIGQLGLAPQKKLADTLEVQFIKEQKTTFGLIAFCMVMLAALLTLPITSRLVRPIKTLATSTRELTSGNYKVRTPVTSEDELGQLSRDFNVLADTLEQNEQARRQWVADISHELRTPLAVLRGEIEAIQDQVREVTPQTLKRLHGEVLQLNRLISDLYELSMSDLGALTYKKETIVPLEVLKDTIELFKPRIDAHNLKMVVELDVGAGVELLADQDRLQQLFANLLENSLRYTEAGGCLELRTESDGHHLTIHLLDSAPGVSASELPHLFDRLYRVESSRNRAIGGAGLGLSICRNIVEAHGGVINAQSSPLGGLWQTITLPLNG